MAKYFNAKKQKFLDIMAQARDYATWRDAALELDYLEGNVEWKESYVSPLYNYELIYNRLMELRTAHQRHDTMTLVRSLREGLHHDLGNLGNKQLYQKSHVGTKHLIEEYVNQVCASIDYVCHEDIPELPVKQKLDFFKDTSLSFGRPALLLSGGASLGLFHLGVIKALWERGLLPQVITGSSVGAVIAAILGAHTDEEIPMMLDPGRHNMKAWRWLGVMSGLMGKGFMDIRQLESVLRSNVGEYTFLESYQRTGRSINITVSPTHRHEEARLLSGYTSPYLLMWSAALASSAVPAIFPPVQLMKKDQFGNAIPYMPTLRWVDGSVVSDLPIERLMHLYDVNFTIVSQINPHIVPFLNTKKRATKQTLAGLPLRVLKSEMRFHGTALFNSLRKMSESEILRQSFGQIYTVLAQRYHGDMTISPKYTLWHYKRVLSNPTPDMIERMMLEGERATWPKIAMIRSHSKISLALEKAVSSLKQRLQGKKPELRVVNR
jgi:TAG lipase/steryl ester hydrolase/phospholipase A2/LPA acyltransferase